MNAKPTLCYCDRCKKSLSDSHLVDKRNVWCPKCESLVRPSSIRMESWVLGVVVILLGNSMFHLV